MDFNQQVYSLCRKVPFGKVTTYGEIARALGCKGYQAVGNALNKNMFGIWSCNDERMVPCHRVVFSDGRVGGFALGTDTKIMILKKEGIEVKNGKIIDFEKRMFRLDGVGNNSGILPLFSTRCAKTR